jgi:pyruvate/2-oxoglutarate dehydrogenase complex dihydrolipoamide acyltransferase (E2) component
VTVRRAIALLAGALLLAACGSGGGSSSSSATPTTAATTAETATTDATPNTARTNTATKNGDSGELTIRGVDPSKYLRGSSVGFGEGPAPTLSPTVRRAAKRAGCTLRSDPSAVGIHLLLSDVAPLHTANPDYSKQKRPPTNGLHRPIWANWGFYQQPVPYAYEVHNLEHGAVVIHIGLRVTRTQGTRVIRMWAKSPPYLLIVPGLPADVSQRGVTVTSWQRAMVCKKWNARTVAAIRTYRDVYRGTGPEQIPSLNSGSSAEDLPTPVLPDPTG